MSDVIHFFSNPIAIGVVGFLVFAILGAPLAMFPWIGRILVRLFSYFFVLAIMVGLAITWYYMGAFSSGFWKGM